VELFRGRLESFSSGRNVEEQIFDRDLGTGIGGARFRLVELQKNDLIKLTSM
jgi:hypothetical protein